LPLQLELPRKRRAARSSEATEPGYVATGIAFESRPVGIVLRDYGLGLSFEVEGERTPLSEVRLTLHLIPAPESDAQL
jgi:hypothetical protein